ncbi:MAG TPA: HDIG domain-containing protein [Candidatus Nitrosotenuis sp.]|jgi:putative nucleotidyltransferase with HDIG domain|nr:HDIG domain-containing protein [Candidatus Nitrosotenuis sp.]
MRRDEAWSLVCQHVRSESLRKHLLAVEACMRFYARTLGEDEELWGVVGLLHDFDYERWPEPPEHTRKGAEILLAHGVDEEIVGAILSHADWNASDYPRDRPLRRALFAVDELSGFLVACALVRPQRFEGLEPASVRKKLKTPSFAAAVSRQDIQRGAELLGLDLDQHIANCIQALRQAADSLGLAPAGKA